MLASTSGPDPAGGGVKVTDRSSTWDIDLAPFFYASVGGLLWLLVCHTKNYEYGSSCQGSLVSGLYNCMDNILQY